MTSFPVKFLARKCLYDFLDHFFTFLLLNAGFLISIIISLGCCSLLQLIFRPAGFLFIPAAAILVIFIVTIYTGAAAGLVHAMTENKPVALKIFLNYLKSSLKNSLLLALMHSLFFFLFLNALFFYTGVKWVLGPAAAAVIIWLGLIWYAASQYFFAIHYRLEKKFFHYPCG